MESELFFHSQFAVPGRLAIVLDLSMIDFRRHFEIRFALVESAAIGDLSSYVNSSNNSRNYHSPFFCDINQIDGFRTGTVVT